MRVGIVGCGWFGQIHAETWSCIDGVEIVGAFDVNPEAFIQHAMTQSEFHCDVGESKENIWDSVPRYNSLIELIEHGQLDLLDVVVPEKHHYEIAMEALQNSVNVFVEKPFVLSSTESRLLLDKAAENDCQIHVGHILRFDDRYTTAINELRASEHEVLHLSLERNFQRSAHRIYGRTHPFLSACIHDIDIAIWAYGHPPTKVTGFTSSKLREHTPDIVIGVLEWQSGSKAVIQNNWHLSDSCPYAFYFSSTFQTASQTIRIQNTPVVEIWNDSGKVVSPEFFFWPLSGQKRKGAILEEMTYVRDCVANNQSSVRMPVLEAHYSICVAEALIESAEKNTSVFVNY